MTQKLLYFFRCLNFYDKEICWMRSILFWLCFTAILVEGNKTSLCNLVNKEINIITWLQNLANFRQIFEIH